MATTAQKTRITGWHKADIKAALEKRGWTLSALSLINGYHRTAAEQALRRPWPAIELIIANACDTVPWFIWPDRYDSKNKPRRGRHPNDSTAINGSRNVKNQGANRHAP